MHVASATRAADEDEDVAEPPDGAEPDATDPDDDDDEDPHAVSRIAAQRATTNRFMRFLMHSTVRSCRSPQNTRRKELRDPPPG